MTNKSTKRALISSVVSLFLCFVMLTGTTFAWFTDIASSNGNVIETGTLDVELWQHFADAESVNISDSSDPIFGKADSTSANADSANTLWEPGKTQTVYLSIKNNGTLDLKYKVAIEVTNITNNLNEVLTYIITPDAKAGEITTDPFDADGAVGNSIVSGINVATEDVALAAGGEHFFALSVHMDEEAGNEYQDSNIQFNIKVLAGQLSSESDSFNNEYDKDATYPELNYVEIPSGDEFPVAGLDVNVYNDSGVKVGSMCFPADSLGENATHVAGSIVETETYAGGNITIDDGNEVIYYDITASGLKSDNDVPVIVRIYVGENYDPNTFVVYHYDQVIEASYNPETGYVTFETATFSPFAIVYDADSVYDPYDPNDTQALPQANVVNSTEYENVSLPWGSYGQWSPDADIDADPKLEAAYTFSCIQTLEQAKASKYAEWHCDFVVVLDTALEADQIFLGGNYGSFGWVGFHNGDLTLDANTEIPLLGSVTSNAWTYVDVVQNVGTFICGVGDVNDALAGANFTVMLRLTNPNDSTEFYNIETITYTFQ